MKLADLMEIKEKHMTTVVEKRPNCDFCGKEAKFDGKTVFGAWAYMCGTHFSQFGIGLGLGKGQELIEKK